MSGPSLCAAHDENQDRQGCGAGRKDPPLDALVHSADRDVLGPWVNTRRRSFFTAIVIWVLVLLSLALTAATLFKNIPATTLQVGLIAGVGVGAIGGARLCGRSVAAPCDAHRPVEPQTRLTQHDLRPRRST